MVDPARHPPQYVGYVPILFLALGSWAGFFAADALSQSDAIGSAIGAVLGYFGSRAALRSYFTRHMS